MSTEENNSNETSSLIDFICEGMKENDEFLTKNAKDVYEEVIGLVNDAINLEILLAKKFKAEEAIAHPMVFFAMHVLMPMSYGIYVNLLVGNLPTCFMELRLIHETMAKCYIAERDYPGQEDFSVKLETLEHVLKKKRITISKFMREMLGHEAEVLWKELSEEWVHSRGVLRYVIGSFEEKGVPPSSSMTIPASYAENDLDSIKELGTQVAEFRKLLRRITENQEEFIL